MVLTVKEERVADSLHTYIPRQVQSSWLNFLLNATINWLHRDFRQPDGLDQLVRIEARDQLN